MSAAAELLASVALESMVSETRLYRHDDGTLSDSAGPRVLLAEAGLLHSVQHVLEQERAGTWREIMKSAGHACGRSFAADLDARLTAMGKPVLAALPLEVCLVFVEHSVANQGWGELKVDLSAAAEHGLVIARLQHSSFAEMLPPGKIFADPFLAGILQGFFEHISGQNLGCEEIGCARRTAGGPSAPHCTFVITAPERLATIMAVVGKESADALIARLRS